MSQERTEAAFAKAAGHLYAVGGLIPDLVTVPTVEIYDISADSWSDGPPLPVAVNHAMATGHKGIVYVAGGYTAAVFGATNTFLAFVDGAWEVLPPLPETRAAGGLVGVGDKLYLIGGFVEQGQLAEETLVYDIVSQTWTTGPAPPTLREHLSVVVHRGLIYAIGGRTGDPNTNMSVMERFDPATERWRRLPSMPTPRSGHASAVTKSGFIVTLGGEYAGGIFATNEAYDLKNRRWRTLPPMTSERTGLGIAAVGTKIFTFYGAAPEGYLDVTQSMDLASLRR
jgi:N-acetylneuraminic acid mutarotase